MHFLKLFAAGWAALLLTVASGPAMAQAPKKKPSIQVIKNTKTTEEDVAAAEMKPIEHFDTDVPKNASLFAHMAALAERAYDELETRHIGTEEIGGRHAVLALWKPSDPSYGLDIVNIIDGTSRTEGVDIEVTKAEGLGSKYVVTVSSQEGLEVFAMRTNVTDERWQGKITRKDRVEVRGKKKKSTWKTVTRTVEVTYFTTEPAVYVPYSDSQISLEAAFNGLKYLYDQDTIARFLLRSRNVRSKVDPSKYVYELIPRHMTVATLINEHTDHDEFDRLGVTYTLMKALITTSLNRERTYNYSGSWAGAYGYAQFIRTSYAATVKGCKNAKLIPDFHEGMRDHVNAIMAQYCYMDATLLELTPDQRARLFKADNHDLLVQWLAAAYNGAPARAAKSYARNTASWTTMPCSALAQPKSKQSGKKQQSKKVKPTKAGKKPISPCLAGETLFYLKKVRAIEPMLRELNGDQLRPVLPHR